jgi:thioredoxin 1
MNSILLISGSLVILILAYIFFSYRRLKNIPVTEKSDKIWDLTDKNFHHQVKTGITLIDFWAAWCVPCKMMAPVLNDLAEVVPSGVKVCKVNVEEYQSLASKFAVRGIPTMVLLQNGREVNRFVGVKSKEFLLNQINRVK